jgi:hypothetical protein
MIENIIITEEMRQDAYFVYRNNHAYSNAEYPLMIGIYKQLKKNHVCTPFKWQMTEDIIDLAKKLNDKLVNEYRTERFKK